MWPAKSTSGTPMPPPEPNMVWIPPAQTPMLEQHATAEPYIPVATAYAPYPAYGLALAGIEDDYDSEEELEQRKVVLEMHCDTHFNMNNLIVSNILRSVYWKITLAELNTVHDIVQEIVQQVTHLEPFTLGHSRAPSTAFCLLYKLCTIRMTEAQMSNLLEPNKTAFERGIGFLYLRYTHPPKLLFDWFEPYLDDEQQLKVSGIAGPATTIGAFVRKLLTEITYYDTIFPRIPIPILRAFKMKMLGAELTADEYNSAHNPYCEDGSLMPGLRIKAQYWEDAKYYDAIIDQRIGDEKYLVTFVDYGTQEEVIKQCIRLLSDKVPRSRRKQQDKLKAEAAAHAKRKERRDSPASSSSRSKDHHRDHEHSRERHRDRHRHRDRRRHHRSSRSRSRSPHSSRSRRRSRSPSPQKPKLVDIEAQILRQERESALASGKDYARRPCSTKAALTMQLQTATYRKRSRSRTPPRRREVVPVFEGPPKKKRPASPPRKSSPVKPEMSKAAQQKLALLRAKYGDASTT